MCTCLILDGPLLSTPSEEHQAWEGYQVRPMSRSLSAKRGALGLRQPGMLVAGINGHTASERTFQDGVDCGVD